MVNETDTQNTPDEQLAAAKQDIENVLQKYNIVLVPVTMHYGDKTVSRIDIVPASKQAELTPTPTPAVAA